MKRQIIKKDQKYVNILSINILSTTEEEVLTSIAQKISHSSKPGSRSEKFSIFTPNPELVLASNKDKKLQKVINAADLNVPDGVGLSYASEFLYQKPLTIIPGRKLFIKLVELAEKKGWKVFLLGGQANEAVLAAEHLISAYPNIYISTSQGPTLNTNGDAVTEVDKRLQSDVVTKINQCKPQLLFVAFGNPKQEFWIAQNLKKLNVNAVMTVGGAFRYIAGISKPAPKWMENAGLEWLWRLITEPVRIKRIWNAAFVFPIKVFLSKLA